MVDEPNHEIVIHEVPNYGRLIPPAGTPLARCPTNLEPDDEQQWCLLMNGRGEGDFALDEHGEIIINVTWYAVLTGSHVDEDTGELKEYPRTVLYTAEGKTFVTTSEVVPHRLADVVDRYGNSMWDPPVRMHIRERRGRKSKRTYHELRVLPRL